MKSPLKLGLNMITLCLVSMWIYSSSNLRAVNTQSAGWRLESTTWEIDTPEGCVRARNDRWEWVYIPTKTSTEWNAFKSDATNERIRLFECIPVSTGGDGDGGDGSSRY